MNSKGIDCLGDNGVCIPVSTHSVKTVKKQTRADVIRSMSDEELAEFLGRYFNCEYKCEAAKEDCFENCNRAIIEWLQSEAE